MVTSFLLGIVRSRLSIDLASPDDNSGRTLVLITRPKKNPYHGIKIMSWHKHELSKIESFMGKIGIYPQW